MIRRSTVIVVEILFAIIVIVTGILLWASFYVDTDEFRHDFTHTLEQFVGLPVSLEGELNIALFPNPSLEVVGLILHNPPEYENDVLVSFETVGVGVRLLPLYSKRVELDRIDVEGMRVNIIQRTSDENNLTQLIQRFSSFSDDSVSSEPAVSDAFQIMTLNGIEISNANITYNDLAGGDSMSFDGIDIRTGAIQSGKPVSFTADSAFAWNEGEVESSIVFKGMVQFNAESGALQVHDASLNASVGGSFLPEGAAPGELTSAISLDWEGKSISLDNLRLGFLGLRAEGHLKSGNLTESTAATGKITIKPFSPLKIIRRFNPEYDSGENALHSGQLSTSFNVDQSGFAFSNLIGRIDQTQFSGRGSITGFSSPVVSAALDVDSIVLDNYIISSGSKSHDIVKWGDIPLELFGKLSGDLTLNVGSAQIEGHSLSKVSIGLNADKGALTLATSTVVNESSFAASAKVLIEENDTRLPVLSLNGIVDASSSSDGFSFIQTADARVTGQQAISISFDGGPFVCNPVDPITSLLSAIKGNISWKAREGQLRISQSKDKQAFAFAEAQLQSSLQFNEVANDDYRFGIDGNLHLKKIGTIQSMSLAAAGEVGLNLKEGAVKSPGLNVKVGANGTIQDVAARVQSSGTIAFDSNKGTLNVRKLSLRTLGTTLNADLNIKDLNKSFSGKGSFNIPNANVRHIIYELTKFSYQSEDPEALTKASLQGNITFNSKGFTLRALKGNLDGMPIKGEASGNSYVDPKINFSLSAGEFDLDRYLPPSDDETASSGADDAVDLPLTFLRMLNVSGKAHFDLFKMFDVYLENLNGSIEADKGKILISSLEAVVNKGTATGHWSGKIGQSELLTRLKVRLSGMDMGGFMDNQFQRQYLRGQTDAMFDLTSTGKTDEDIVDNLAGTAWIRMTNGSYKFIGYDDSASKQKAKSSDFDFYKNNKNDQRTSFSKTTSEMTIKKGVINLDRFRMEAPPILQAYGQGWISLASNKIDVSIRNDFVAVPSVTVSIKGALSNPQISFPKGNIVNDTVRNVLGLPEKSFNFLLDIFK